VFRINSELLGDGRCGGNIASVLSIRVGIQGCCSLSLEAIRRELQADMHAVIMSWTRARLRQGAEGYLLRGSGLPDQWSRSRSEEPFDLLCPEPEVTRVPMLNANVPVLERPVADRLASTTGRVTRLAPNAGSTPGAL
jgi:hypothetical protein